MTLEIIVGLLTLVQLVSIWVLHRARLELERERDELRRRQRALMGVRDKKGA